MKRTVCLICAVLLAAAAMPVSAQVELSCTVSHSRLLQYEPIRVKVRIENHLSQPLVLSGSDPASVLEFDIEQAPGQALPAWNRSAFPAIEVPPHRFVEKEVNLLRLYDMRGTGPYSVRARVDLQGRSFVSPKLYLDVLPGFEIARAVGDAGGSGAQRTYTLRTLNRARGEEAFLRVDADQEGVCRTLLNLGPIVRLYPPLLRVDGFGGVHILHQAAPSRFVHTALTSEGKVVESESYSSEVGSPGLEMAEDGSVIVTGGQAAGGPASEPELDRAPAPGEPGGAESGVRRR